MPDALLETDTEFLWQSKKKNKQTKNAVPTALSVKPACLNPVG